MSRASPYTGDVAAGRRRLFTFCVYIVKRTLFNHLDISDDINLIDEPSAIFPYKPRICTYFIHFIFNVL